MVVAQIRGNAREGMGLGELMSSALDQLSLVAESGVLVIPDRQVETSVWRSRRSVGW